VLAAYLPGQGQARGVGAEQAQLHAQAFRQIAGAAADRVEVLDDVENGFDLGGIGDDMGRKRRLDVLEGRVQVAIVVDRFDQGLSDRQVARTQMAELQLPHQVGVQVHRRGGRQFVRFVFALATALVGTDRLLPFRGFAWAEVVAVRAVGAGFAAFRLGGLVAGGGFGAVVALRLVLAFEQRVGFDRDREFGLQLDRRELQQPDRLAQLGRQGKLLAEPGLEGGLHGAPRGR
jgi:hypothetical protein